MKSDGRFDDAADLIEWQAEGGILHLRVDHPLLDIADIAALGRGRPLGKFCGELFKRLAVQKALVDGLGIRAEFLLRGRVFFLRQQQKDLLDPNGLLPS